MKYKLIKLLPFENSPRIGYTSEPHLSQKDEDHYWNGLWFNPENYPEFWEEVVEKDYEILSLSFTNNFCYLQKNGEYAYRNTYNTTSTLKDYLSAGWKIHSVKRLSDSEIFTIGDKVVGYNNSIAKIKTIDLVGEISLNIGTDKHEGFSLKNLKKVKKPLFTTENGVDIFEGDYYYYFRFHSWTFDKAIANQKFHSQDKLSSNSLYFSTKEKAEEYILLNKPCLSYGDVQEYLKIKDCNKVLDLAQSKIQQSV